MRVRITPALGYAHGHVETVLWQMGINVPVRRPDGIVEMEMSEQQVNTFQLKGGAHRVERNVPEPAEEAAPVNSSSLAMEPELAEVIVGPAKVHEMSGGLYGFRCPGCQYGHSFRVGGDEEPKWEWNGSFDKPTFTPSLMVNRGGQDQCHLNVTNGKIQFHGDCWHSLAGRLVEMENWDEETKAPEGETKEPKS